jgi:hypothetical protein
MDFEDAGKTDYNIGGASSRESLYGKLPEKLLNAALG